MTTLWKIACQEDVYPGMWQRWYKNQCVAVGWPAAWGYKLSGLSEGGKGWSAARNAIKEMQLGDYVIVALRGHRVGRLGQITGKAIEDEEWNPLVPVGPGLLDGEMGRRIQVRWDLTVGPDNQDLVVQLPDGTTFSSGELRPTVSRIQSLPIEALKQEMNDPTNWVSLLGNFKYEKALSDFIANYPNRLEDGLLPHPNSKIRERVFKDRTRLDVLLIDRQNKPVIVECKQHAPSSQDINQLRHYMKLLKEETGEVSRGILVHGGAAKLSGPVMTEALCEPVVEIVSYGLEVIFRPSVSVANKALPTTSHSPGVLQG
ncbi:MAG: endonuclease NucS domain-containing protein [Nitrospirota bacterium]